MIKAACKHERKISKGKDRKGQQRWKCKECGVSWTDRRHNPLGNMRLDVAFTVTRKKGGQANRNTDRNGWIASRVHDELALLAWIIHELHEMAIVRTFVASERRFYSSVTTGTS